MLKLDEKLDQKTGVQNTRPRQGVLSPEFWAMFGPVQGQTPFLTVKTADSGLENKNILKLDKTLRQNTGMGEIIARPTLGRTS